MQKFPTLQLIYNEENQINDILLKGPKLLPCGETICSFCVSSIKELNFNMFKFLVCEQDLVKEYCIDLISDVQLKIEEAIQQINEISSKIINEIDEYENELIEFNKSNLKPLDEYDKFASKLEACYAINSEYLKQHTIGDDSPFK